MKQLLILENESIILPLYTSPIQNEFKMELSHKVTHKSLHLHSIRQF
jgi:hypothetical protein